MIQFLERHNIDVQKWDAVVSASWHETSYGYSWYLDAATPEWSGLVLDDYKAVMPVVTSKKMGIKYILNVSYMQYTSIFGLKPDQSMVNRFMSAIPKSFKLLDFKLFLPFIPNIKHAEINTKTNLIFDLNRPYSILSKRYNTNTKRNIKKAVKQNITLTSETDPTRLIETYKAFKLRKYKTEFKPESIRRLIKIIENSIQQGRGELVYAWNSGGDFLGGTYFQKSQTRLIYLFSASEEAAQSTGAMAYVVDQQIRKYAEQNLVLDFEGSEIKGIARFYRGFGADNMDYYHVKINRLPGLLRWFKK